MPARLAPGVSEEEAVTCWLCLWCYRELPIQQTDDGPVIFANSIVAPPVWVCDCGVAYHLRTVVHHFQWEHWTAMTRRDGYTVRRRGTSGLQVATV